MPLLFKAKMSSMEANTSWRSLDISPSTGMLVWVDNWETAGCSKAFGTPKTITEQADLILKLYNPFYYSDKLLVDRSAGQSIPSWAHFLNIRGDKPDFTHDEADRGWILPNGDFIANRDGDHANLSIFTLGGNQETIKEEGWIIVQPAFIMKPNKAKPPTEEQLKTLGVLGFDAEMKRAKIPAWDAERFEPVRNLYRDRRFGGDTPVRMNSDEAAAIIMDVKQELGNAHLREVAIIFNAMQQIATGNPDADYISRQGGRVNLMQQKSVDRHTDEIASLRL